MGLGTVTLLRNSNDSGIAAAEGPDRAGDKIVERYRFKNADSNRATDFINTRFITRIDYVLGSNTDNYGSSDPFTIDNSVFPPKVTLNGIMTGDGGEFEVYGK